MKSAVKILVAGDFCPKDRVSPLLENPLCETLHNVMPIIKQSDLAIVNLECPLVSSKNALPIVKEGPNLKSVPAAAKILKKNGFSLTTLANNHIMDYGSKGLVDTLDTLKKEGLDYVGVGENLRNSSLPYYYTKNGTKIGIVNCCEHEFSIATETSAGANPLNPIHQWYAIKDAKCNADYVIVIIHGGHEHYSLPSPRMQETYRFFIDAGADAVINHHQHCYSGYEIYKEKPIFYGLGNFCFDWNGKRDSKWNYGYMVELQMGTTIDFTIYPYEQCNATPDVCLLEGVRKTLIEEDIVRLNRIIQSPEQLKVEHEKWMLADERNWLISLLPVTNRYVKALIQRQYLPLKFRKNKISLWFNRIACEAHRDKLLYILSKQL